MDDSMLYLVIIVSVCVLLIIIARTFAYGDKNGRSLEDSMQHFHDKLLLLKDEMNTDEAKKMAAERHEYLEGFLEEFKAEANGNILRKQCKS